MTTTATIPKEGDLVVRRIPFEFPDDLDPIWNPEQPEWSHMVNGASLTMPYLEPFLIHTVREASPLLEDDKVREEAKGFIAQEGQHHRTHRRYNNLLKANGYPELAKIEDEMQRAYKNIEANRSLAFRLGYTCGFETMTLGLTKWLVTERRRLFGRSNTTVASFIVWHFVEEAEHKRVAFNVYKAVHGGYWHRLLGIFTGSLHVVWYARKAAVLMLKKDGRWNDLRSRWRLWRRTAEFFAAIVPEGLSSAMPGHDPDNGADPKWVRDWIAGYAQSTDPGVPLLDTNDPSIPIPFR